MTPDRGRESRAARADRHAREARQVAALARAGFTRPQIAEALGMSTGTVRDRARLNGAQVPNQAPRRTTSEERALMRDLYRDPAATYTAVGAVIGVDGGTVGKIIRAVGEHRTTVAARDNPDIRARVAELRATGMSGRAIARALGMSEVVARDVCAAIGDAPHHRGSPQIPAAVEARIIDLVRGGASNEAIAAEFGTSLRVVSRVLKRAGLMRVKPYASRSVADAARLGADRVWVAPRPPG